ncbi:hypothetical protein TraAM80_07021 [Trypanosoma rangeli]|uniref:Uncharacterized protein n=1 Tax=Trypanosoma rangeli TaxID=5698 RepID=A0A3R7MF49_TRYRA|nr:uncharacterized protein TraAM80_07021 [Trypanosoma rangeli]RNF01374.1 hypothetical protein TraAM80_07021 [Trypanosoma rangeli]|eukprot:RNF01374.1 hypothetical protein TraAM80_07021 [Trypanosoma rangeli]
MTSRFHHATRTEVMTTRRATCVAAKKSYAGKKGASTPWASRGCNTTSNCRVKTRRPSFSGVTLQRGIARTEANALSQTLGARRQSRRIRPCFRLHEKRVAGAPQRCPSATSTPSTAGRSKAFPNRANPRPWCGNSSGACDF